MEIQVTKFKVLKQIPVQEHPLIRVWHGLKEFVFHKRFTETKYITQLQLWVTPTDYVVPGQTVVSDNGKVWLCTAKYPLSIVVDSVEAESNQCVSMSRLIVIANTQPEHE